ncbi:SH3 domain-containing protein [Streptomyces sp. WAC 01420]|uniref:SH3 domain-containing protein n=1 Tax=Streptomyces sp. WAC 01420 TaxID=2203203 RepID=UPI000AA707BF|nr:SH3 domain-containing protein [Streptomyces sp. WAC 01420]RSM99805.1 SH3 domain-containing protein [Streptomyces sp. WAC 01420]
MAPRPPFSRRLPIALAAGAFAVAAAVTPALAADDPNQSGQGNWSQQGGNSGGGGSDQQGGNGGHQQQGGGGNQGGNGGHDSGSGQLGGGGGNGHHQGGNQGEYKGVVTTNRLALRTAPNRGARVIRYAHKGEVVSIFCKVPGDRVNGNPLWYLLTDGTWAWGPAGHIDNIGPAPRWC